MLHLPWKRPFRDLVRRQLAIFAQDHAVSITAARKALQEFHTEPDPELAQVSYAQHDDTAEDIELALHAMWSTYEQGLEPTPARRYTREFMRQARAAYGDLVPELTLYGRLDEEQ